VEISRLAEFEDWYWWHRARTEIVTSVLRRTVPTGSKRILDVGCGAGGTSLALREFGSVLGVDFRPSASEAARARGLQVASMDLRSLGVRTGSVDIAVALDVLEHVDDDHAAGLELSRVLKRDGVLLVTVPAYQWLWSSHDVALGHVRRYTRGSLTRVLEQAGFSVETASYAMSFAFPPAAVLRLFERAFRRRSRDNAPQSGYVRLPSLANAALTRLVALDRHIIGRLPIPWGLSVIAFARKVDDGGASRRLAWPGAQGVHDMERAA
jgi:SAM-dependent methyltransferase